ncbi:MAG: hypothetical protein E7399_09005 [Ruminococcaceae bacterium]|nr:hypothetical protein [Oscillospiraceae bacterium]
MEISNGFVVVMGLGVVFFGLICIVVLCSLMSLILKERGQKKEVPASPVAAPPVQVAPIANKQEIIAGVCAVIAEELGTDVTSIKVLSFKQI